MTWEVDAIEEILISSGVEVEDYTDPRKGITQLEAVINAVGKLVTNSRRGERE